jgi:5-methylcytosine-specific restriction endonuclease McrA
MEVERFDSNLEYTKDNCAMACYWCNNAKTDEFTKEEFQPIADQIKLVWETRLAEK